MIYSHLGAIRAKLEVFRFTGFGDISQDVPNFFWTMAFLEI